ncbi:MAG: hypothetical protein JXB49_11780 [Bacteroidales bacterium]|nr:hypothetical protein [Bacteroidales bacterium]
MKKTLYKKIIIVIAISLCITSCEEMILGPQPNFLEDPTHIPMLNIMGVIRPDSLDSLPMSFIRLEKSVKVPYDTSETWDAPGAVVEVYRMENGQAVDTTVFYQTRFEGVFQDSVYRSDHFYPKAGETYSVFCTYENLPELTSETTIPATPVLTGNNIKINLKSIEFTVQYDSMVTMYDVAILINNEAISLNRYFREEDADLDISLPFEISGFSDTDTVEMIVYAYDEKLTEYITTSPSAIWPNTYQPRYSTVNNGYGCFGSLNLKKWKLN